MMTTPLHVLLTSIPPDKIDFQALSMNPLLTPDLVSLYCTGSWNLFQLTVHPNVHLGFISTHFGMKWDLPFLEKRYPDVFWNLIEKQLRKGWIPSKEQMEKLCIMEDFRWHLLDIKINWNYDILSKHPQLKWNSVSEFSDFYHLSGLECIDWDVVRKYHHCKWDWKTLTYKEGLPVDLVRDYPSKGWDLVTICRFFPEDVIDIIDAATTRVSSYVGCDTQVSDVISMNPGISWKWMQKYLKHLNASILLRRSDIDWDIVAQNYHLFPYQQRTIAEKVPIEIVLKYPDVKWDWIDISKRVSLEILVKNPKAPWDWRTILRGSTFDEYRHAVKIQQWWRMVYYRPGGPHEKRIHQKIASREYQREALGSS